MEYIEVRDRTVEDAIQVGLKELGLASQQEANIEVIDEGQKGFLGMGGRDAVVRMRVKTESRRRRTRDSGRKDKSHGDRQGSQPQKSDRQSSGRHTSSGGGNSGARRQSGGQQRRERPHAPGPPRATTEGPNVEEQAEIIKKFLTGLVAAFDLEGDVEVSVEPEETIVANVVGEQTEALVGPKGSVMSAIHELSRTAAQRHGGGGFRLRLDVAGYAERRRQALAIYANQLIDQVVADGGELMLEPMTAADRKVIHDAVAARDGVRSYSEGDAPTRYVVIAPATEVEEDQTSE